MMAAILIIKVVSSILENSSHLSVYFNGVTHHVDEKTTGVRIGGPGSLWSQPWDLFVILSPSKALNL